MTDALLPVPEQALVLRVRIVLDDAEPEIWRQLELRGDLTLDVVHELLQAAMGWENYHLHRFWRGTEAYRPDEPRFVTEFDLAEGEEGLLESEVRLDQVLREPGDQVGYLYDFGDDWHHTLTVEAVRAAVPEEVAGRCLAGERACPPEDIGGVWFYTELVAALGGAVPDSQYAEWIAQTRAALPVDFDPTRFEAAQASAAMAEAVSRSAAVADLMATPVAALRTLAGRLGGDGVELLAALVQEAAAAPAPDPQAVAAALRPWQVLLDVVGADGVELTAAGRLKPAVVEELARRLGVDRWWIGKVNREDQTLPIAWLRETAQAARLIRKYKGRLVPTPAGRKIGTDTGALWDHLAGALPLDREEFAQEGGAIWLLCLAAGRDDAADIAARILTAAGWRVDRSAPVERYMVLQNADLTQGVQQTIKNAFRGETPRNETAVDAAAAPVIRALAAHAVLGR